jgi:hypothetical protein
MMAQSPQNIKSFFEPTSSPSQSPRKNDLPIVRTTPAAIGDGPTQSKVRNAAKLDPDGRDPQHDYEAVSIGQLAPGPRRVSFTTRVVNLYDQSVNSKMQNSAKGCLKVLVKDDSAFILACRSLPFLVHATF